MIEFYHKSDVVDNLWAEYKKTSEFKTDPSLIGIRQDHPIVIRREEEGLKRIINILEKELGNSKVLYLKKLQQRVPGEWVKEWLSYHKILFERVLDVCGVYRRKEVWFDTLEASEKEYKIPKSILVPARMSELAVNVCNLLKPREANINDKLRIMARVHFEFIRIHPFVDGNGRVGRMIIDQLCLAFSLPTIMGGYPRADIKQRRAYHDAIKESCNDPNSTKLVQWISSKLEEKAKLLG
ncbi:MAG: Filamentation induced by cAMP protein Fic [Candidatus Gottesmanbacteria bacterium GW2011_GWC2_39_8]|uniref:Filamentation induced by cAMP protein Fic n=1 Tax=Candidatus Gottesmanbacteria bacterium GW2011_GWC2_39_8 TaxID=1618450 RepID=A0A0G0PW57_9BACT|nr:MAG: Filamentation induced by cAMP protein Fic [Candidatus Gottesmanbacteria bacterium GW2011_GWC2_39_8]